MRIQKSPFRIAARVISATTEASRTTGGTCVGSNHFALGFPGSGFASDAGRFRSSFTRFVRTSPGTFPTVRQGGPQVTRRQSRLDRHGVAGGRGGEARSTTQARQPEARRTNRRTSARWVRPAALSDAGDGRVFGDMTSRLAC